MIPTEKLPGWLDTWSPGSPFSSGDFFNSRVVYYPGSGTDGQPVLVFGSRHAAHCFVFVDYGITKSHILRELGSAGHPFAGYQSVGRIDVAERELTPSGWVPHVRPVAAQRPPTQVVSPYAFMEILERAEGFNEQHGPKRLALLFLAAEGVAAYDALFCQAHGRAPFAIVLQDHGFGGNWTRFGCEGALEHLAVTTERLPEYLLVATNTRAWTGYAPIDGDVTGGGGMHGFNRQVYRRDPMSQPPQN